MKDKKNITVPNTKTDLYQSPYVEPISSDFQKSKFYKIRIFAVPKDKEEDLTELCFSFGVNGLTEALQFSQPDLTYDPGIVFKRFHDIDAYFNDVPDKKFFDELQELIHGIRWEIVEEESKDWLAEWKKSFQPFAFVGPYWIVPTWMEKPAEARVGLFIDPGMAFGTGTHPTTKMAGYFVHKLGENLKKQKQDLNKLSLLDVGTGTAVLAMMAHHEGIGHVVGIEIDPEARRVAKENITRNQLESIEIWDKQLDEITDSFDFVVANIIDGVLVRIKNELLKALKPGGQIFLTGILTERDNYFFEKFIEDSRLQVIRRLEKEEWVGYWLQDTRLNELLCDDIG